MHDSITRMLEQFQAAYIGHDVADLLAPDCVVIGTGPDDWRFGREAAREVIGAQWERWGALQIDVAKAQVGALGDVAWFAVPGTVSATIDPEEFRAAALAELRHVVGDGSRTYVARAAEIMRTAANALYETEKGAAYTWPFRLLGVLVEREGRWLFGQLQFAFPTTTTPDERGEVTKPLVELPRTPETEAVRSVLQAFQAGYDRREQAQLDAVMDLFVPDPDLLVVGTGPTEWMEGPAGARKLISTDWQYWGQLRLEVGRALISTAGDAAWLATHGTLFFRFSQEESAGNLVRWLEEVLAGKLAPKPLLLELMRESAYWFYGAAGGDEYVFPLRFTAVLVRREGRWRFSQMHFSHATCWTPDLRR